MRYCHEIDTTADVYQVTKEKIENNFIIRNAICMPIQYDILGLKNFCFKVLKEHDKEIPKPEPLNSSGLNNDIYK